MSLGTYPSATEAKQAIEDARTDSRRGEWVDPGGSGITLHAYASAWLDARMSPTLGTKASYRTTLNTLGWLGDVPLGKLTTGHIRTRIAEWADTLKPSTVALRYAHIRHILNIAVEERRLVRNPASHSTVELPRGAGKPRRFLTHDEVTAVTGQMPERFADMTWTLTWHGFRFQEGAGLTAPDVDLDAQVVNLTRQWSPGLHTHVSLKGRDETEVRRVPIVAELLPRMERLVEQAGPFGFLFPGRSGGPWATTTYRTALAAAIKASGVEPFTAHDLRHTCASWLHAMGASPAEAAAWLGHRDATVTQRIYTHLWPSQLDDVAERLSRIRDADLGSGVTRLRKAE